MPHVGIQTDTAIRDDGEQFQEVTGTAIGTTKRAIDTYAFAGLAIPKWDYVANVIAGAVETYTFRLGGSGGTIVAVVVITYVTSSRVDLLNAERTT